MNPRAHARPSAPSPAFLAALLALAAGCSRPPAPVAPTASRPAPLRASAAPPGTLAAPAAKPASTGCEIIERAGSCRLERVEGEDSPASGEREVVAVYSVVGDGAPVRVERRFRVAYLERGEAAHIEHVRAHPVVDCRWQTVVQGACPAHPGRVEIPDAPPGRHPRRARAHSRRYVMLSGT